MIVEWVNGPVDGSIFEVQEGADSVTISFLLPYTIRQALENGWLPSSPELEIPIVEKNGRHFAIYPDDEQRRSIGVHW